MIIGQSAATPTPSDLLTYGAEHLTYEIDMFRHAVELGRRAKDQAAVNVSGELFALHLRNLIAFFWSKRRYPTDVWPRTFARTPPLGQQFKQVIRSPEPS